MIRTMNIVFYYASFNLNLVGEHLYFTRALLDIPRVSPNFCCFHPGIAFSNESNGKENRYFGAKIMRELGVGKPVMEQNIQGKFLLWRLFLSLKVNSHSTQQNMYT